MQLQQFEEQLSSVTSEFDNAIAKSPHDDGSGVLNRTEEADFQMRCVSAIVRASGKNSEYAAQACKFGGESGQPNIYRLSRQMGVAKALLADIKNGYLQSAVELIRGDVFGDYLEMADYLLQQEFKDAAAVLCGGTLEAHIKNLCCRYDIPQDSAGKRVSIDRLNAELTKAGAYSTIEQKSVTAWLALRNHAAHGEYGEYSIDQVVLFVEGVRSFLSRNPA